MYECVCVNVCVQVSRVYVLYLWVEKWVFLSLMYVQRGAAQRKHLMSISGDMYLL